jgi:hypothetical protein
MNEEYILGRERREGEGERGEEGLGEGRREGTGIEEGNEGGRE